MGRLESVKGRERELSPPLSLEIVRVKGAKAKATALLFTIMGSVQINPSAS